MLSLGIQIFVNCILKISLYLVVLHSNCIHQLKICQDLNITLLKDFQRQGDDANHSVAYKHFGLLKPDRNKRFNHNAAYKDFRLLKQNKNKFSITILHDKLFKFIFKEQCRVGRKVQDRSKDQKHNSCVFLLNHKTLHRPYVAFEEPAFFFVLFFFQKQRLCFFRSKSLAVCWGTRYIGKQQRFSVASKYSQTI